MTTANHESPLGALEGMRVLDVAEPLGAFVSRILGDLGADVIKIEPPGGDPGRHLSPFLTTGQERLSLPFVHANVNKRSVILDLEQRQDQERFRALVAQSDVVVSTEGMARLGGPWHRCRTTVNNFIRVWSGLPSRPLALADPIARILATISSLRRWVA